MRPTTRTAIVYLAAITLAEIATVFISPLGGMIAHTGILAAAIVQSSLSAHQGPQRFTLALSLVPLVRVISLSMSLGTIPQIWWYPVIYTPLLVATFAVIRFSGYRRQDVGLVLGRLPVQLLIGLGGFGLGILEYIILVKIAADPLPVPLVSELSASAVWWPALIFIVTTGFGEEIMFRGVLQRGAVAMWGWWGIVYVSLLFAVLHIGFLSWIDVVFVFAVAMGFALVVRKTGSLLGVTIAHGIINATLYLIAPFLF